MMSSNIVKAMILAAGRGQRMQPLTDTCPKPLLKVKGQPLMFWPMQALAKNGFKSQVINTAWLGTQIEAYFGSHYTIEALANSPRLAIDIAYSHEAQDFGFALETLGGICRALPLLSPNLQTPFWVVAGDVYIPEFEFSPSVLAQFNQSNALAHLWLVPNPEHNLKGDFAINEHGLAQQEGQLKYTFSTIALYKPALFQAPYCEIPWGNPLGQAAALAPFLRKAMDLGLVSAEIYQGQWTDVGTPERLALLNTNV
jgi:MurNAc alpha-1-phosphate uridylyltransferase